MFKNREEAGLKLSKKLKKYINPGKTVILSLPRGGVVIGNIISQKLNVPHDILVVKKISNPKNPELALGAIAPNSSVFWNDILIESNIDKRTRDALVREKEKERKNLETLIRGNKKPLLLKDKIVIIADDGVATGATVIAASIFLRKENVKKIILATPVISVETAYFIKNYFDDLIFLSKESNFLSVGQFYKEFPQLENREVIDILEKKNI